MEKLTYHPLRAQEDAIKRALVLGGFILVDDGQAAVVETPDWAIQLFARPEGQARTPIMLDGGTYALRSELLAAQLARIDAHALPLKAFSAGKVYDANDAAHPCHSCVQGVWAAKELPLSEWRRFGGRLVEDVLGVGATAQLETLENGAMQITATCNGVTFAFATAGRATSLARALLGIRDDAVAVWVFDIDVDKVAMAAGGLSAERFYSPLMSGLAAHVSSQPTFGSTYYRRASDLLRAMGFAEFNGIKLYEDGCYKKMNMIQESWDRNNAGMQLDEPLGAFESVPTVLVPALQEALAANWKAGEEECRIFEFGHIVLPGIAGAAPTEKIALVMGAYGPDMDKAAWRATIDRFLADLGIANHFFIPLPPGQAPAYHPADGWVIMDQNMRYLESNFGTISPVALANHGIETDAFMVQFEFGPIEAKAAEEFAFVAPDYQ